MDATLPPPSPSLTNSPTGPIRPLLLDAIRFWEFRRLYYNLALAAASIAWLVATWPHFRPALTLKSLLLLSALALIANACYCAAYLVDIPMQISALGATWKRRRWILWLVGTLFALLLTNYWIADEIYPDVH
ncbi:MAG TPA: hypothetical protein VN087_22800 [Verrucomicrobiae bacterium]|jgi:hypothetical protein|nr:hypothetical protein [Verrucomicrobiae bacterium]